MIFLGMLLGLVGTDVNTGNTRFTFGIGDLFDGIGFVPLAMGVFGIAEIISNLDQSGAPRSGQLQGHRADAHARGPQALASRPVLRGTALGGLLGILPGGGAVLASFSSYTVEKKLSTTPEKFGTGMIEGVAGAGERQQRRRADLLHSHADARHPLQRRHGHDDRRHDDPRHRSRARRSWSRSPACSGA